MLKGDATAENAAPACEISELLLINFWQKEIGKAALDGDQKLIPQGEFANIDRKISRDVKTMP